MKNIKVLFCKPETNIIDIFKIFNDAVFYDLPSGIAIVTDHQNVIIGTVTDGDIRRAIIENDSIRFTVADCMETNPIVFRENLSLNKISELIPIELAKRKRRSRKYLGKIVIVNKKNIPVSILDYHQLWEQKVASHRHIVVVGLGYVGLTMAAVIADSGFLLTGVDSDDKKLNLLQNGENYIHEKGLTELIRKNLNKSFFVSNQIPKDGDVYIISVGTPVDYDSNGINKPTLDYLKDACVKIGKVLQRGNLVVLRSTVPIGTSRNFVKTKLEEFSGLSCGFDFHLSFAPERTAEGRALAELRGLPQIIGGYNTDSVESTAALFRDITTTIVRVDSLEAAEMAKLVNNTFRDYIFAYSNQLAKIASKFNINVVDVINAANKGYVRDPVPLPSPGVGGPCLTKDPYIFASMSETYQFDSQIFIKAREINESMLKHVGKSVILELKKLNKEDEDCNIFVCGLAFKGNPETGDVRNSTSMEIALFLKNKGYNVYGFDPIAKKEDIEMFGIPVVDLYLGFKDADVVMFLNNHRTFEHVNLEIMLNKMRNYPIIYDGWNLFRSEDIITLKPSIYMGLSYTKSSIKL